MVDIKLYNADCLDVLKQLPANSVDLILTDPPYEMENHGGGQGADLANRQLVKDTHIDFMCSGFEYTAVFSEFLRVTKTPNFLIFCSNNQIATIMSVFQSQGLTATLLVWAKTNPIPLCNGKYISDCEYIIWVHGKGATFNNSCPISYKHKLYQGPVVETKDRLHPSQKPIDLLQQYIELHSPENGVILDPYMGSGSTGIACINTHRDFIGIEIQTDYYNIAKRRIDQAQIYPDTKFSVAPQVNNKKLF